MVDGEGERSGVFAWWGPYWKPGTLLYRRYVRGFAKIDASFIARIADPKVRAQACKQQYELHVEIDPKLDRRWFESRCNVRSEEDV